MKIFLTIVYVILGILIFLLLLAALLLFLDFSVILSTEGKKIRVSLRALGITFKIPLNKKEKKDAEKFGEETAEAQEADIMKKFFDIRNNFTRRKRALELALIYMRKKVTINEFGVIGEFGTGNAASTGVAYGAVNAFVNGVFGFLGQYFSLKRSPNIGIKLNYEKPVLNLKFAFMVKTKPWFLLRAFMIYRKNEKIK